MTLGSHICWSLCVNFEANISGKQDELAGSQGLAERSYIRSHAAYTFLEAPILPFIFPLTKNLFTKFIKVFIEITQAQAWD